MLPKPEVSQRQIFNDIKQKITNNADLDKVWRDSLFIQPLNALGEITLFSEYSLNVSNSQKGYFHKVEYDGKVIVTDQWNGQLGQTLARTDGHFRIVVLTEYCEVKPSDLQDERIVVCLPAEIDEKSRETAKEFSCIKQMEDQYRSKIGAEADQIKSWIGGKKPDLLRTLVSTQVPQFQSGKIVTKSQLNISASDIFTSTGNKKQFDKLASILIGNVYTQSPIKEDLMLKIFSPGDTGKLFDGLFHQNAKAADKSAVDNFAAGFGLTKPENKRKFDPIALPVFDYIAAKLESNNGHLQIWQVFDDLTGIPWGMTYPMVALYLVCFVRKNSPSVDLYLKNDHNIVLQSGQKPYNNRISYNIVPELEWKSKIYDYFDTLTKSEGPNWNDVVPYAQVVKPDLVVSNNPTEIESQASILMEGIKTISNITDAVQSSLNLLASKLGGSIPQSELDSVKRVIDLAGAKDHADFYHRVTVNYTSPTAFSQDLGVFRRWEALHSCSASIVNAKSWLDAVALRDTDKELLTDKLALDNQLTLSSLLNNPSLCQSILQQFDNFKRRFRNVYQIHHRDYNKNITECFNILQEAEPKLEALMKLNGIAEIGSPVGTDLYKRFDYLESLTKICPINIVEQVSVDREPCCSECRLS